MTDKQKNDFKIALLAKQQELLDVNTNLEVIVIEKTADELDRIQNASDRTIALNELRNKHRILRAVRAALQRLDDGSFGVCLECDQDISLRRLGIIPWSSCCVQCQERLDASILADHSENEEGLAGAA